MYALHVVCVCVVCFDVYIYNIYVYVYIYMLICECVLIVDVGFGHALNVGLGALIVCLYLIQRLHMNVLIVMTRINYFSVSLLIIVVSHIIFIIVSDLSIVSDV